MSRLADSYRTLAAPATATQTIERSTFHATAAPVADETAARDCLAALRRQHHDARHVCSAWRLGCAGGLREIRHDDGEPAGTAGEPILQAIRGEDLTDTAVAVVRYFGGVKLGSGGLVRAYGGTAAAALAAAPRRTMLWGRCFQVAFPYAQRRMLARLLADHDGRIEDEEYDQEVRWHFWLPVAAAASFGHQLREHTAGRIALRPSAAHRDAPVARAQDAGG